MAANEVSGTKLEELELFYEELRQANGHPLWVRDPNPPKVLPFLWKWSDYRPLLMKAMEVVPMEMANRRALFFANPGLKEQKSATSTLLANLQVIKPGEIAPTHRHSPSALRFVIEGKGAFTSVQGEKSYMEPGDFVTTPNWTWHDHGHEGEGPMIWLDGLDQPLIEKFEALFWEGYEDGTYPLSKANGLSQRMYGAGSLRPTWVKYRDSDKPFIDYQRDSPMVNYKYAQARDTLFQLAKETEGSPFDGVTLEYVNPNTGGAAFATMACFAQLLGKGQHTKAHRHTGGTIYHVIEGKGHSVIGGMRFDWRDKDTFVVPSWSWHEHVSETDAVLFSYNDTPVVSKLGLFREEAYGETSGQQAVTGKFNGKA